MKALGAGVTEVSHKFNIVYAPTRLRVSQESELPAFWESARDVSKSITLKVQIQRLLDVSMSSMSSEPSNAGELARDYKKLVDFNKQQNDEKRELEMQLGTLKKLNQERELKAVRSSQSQAFSLLHLILSLVLGLVAGSFFFRTS